MESRNPSAPFINPPFDLVDILNPSRDKRMSLDSSPSAPPSAGPQSQHSYPSQPEFDQSLNALHNQPPPSAHTTHLNGQSFEHSGDPMDMTAEQSGYEFFPPTNGSNGFGSRYRTNASSSSSLGQGFNGLPSDGLYPHSASPFSDSMASFSATSQHSYGLVDGLPSSYSSGKVSPLTPSDTVMGLQNSPGFPTLPGSNGVGKDYPSQYPDLLDRRHSNAGSFQSDFHDDFSNGGLGLGFPAPQQSLQHFQDRLGRYEPNGHYPGAAPAASAPSQLHHRQSLDMIRGVNPHVTHGGVGFDEMNQFQPMNPTTELALRMPGQSIGVDETLSRMKLQPHVGMGSATDLQSFIR